MRECRNAAFSRSSRLPALRSFWTIPTALVIPSIFNQLSILDRLLWDAARTPRLDMHAAPRYTVMERSRGGIRRCRRRAAMEKKTMIRLIKRYGSRKLYDTEESRYVSLDELAGWIRAGQQIRVIDNKTSDDVTSQTLTQIISEEGRKGTALLPNEMLSSFGSASRRSPPESSSCKPGWINWSRHLSIASGPFGGRGRRWRVFANASKTSRPRLRR